MKFKKILFYFLLTINFNNIIYAQDSNNNIILFDLHGVLLDRYLLDGVKSFFKMSNKIAFLKNVIKHQRDKSQSIGFIANKENRDDINATLNCFKLNTEMAKIIYKLKKAGYKVGIFSNIDLQSLEYMAKKNVELKKLLKVFDFKWVACAENNYATKSSLQTFINCKEKIEDKFGKNITVTLIDDSKKKLELAKNAGFNIYHFKSRNQAFEQKLQSIAPKLNIN